jgi:hypothetical protein
LAFVFVFPNVGVLLCDILAPVLRTYKGLTCCPVLVLVFAFLGGCLHFFSRLSLRRRLASRHLCHDTRWLVLVFDIAFLGICVRLTSSLFFLASFFRTSLCVCPSGQQMYLMCLWCVIFAFAILWCLSLFVLAFASVGILLYDICSWRVCVCEFSCFLGDNLRLGVCCCLA